MANEIEEDEFELQLRQEELARLAKEDGEALSRGVTYTDDDGTVMEWDHERKAYFPKIDQDFIAQYQINYGTSIGPDQTNGQGHELTEEEKKAQQEEFWKNYYNVYSQQQPALPKFDDEGNPIEEDENAEEQSSDSNKAKDKREGDGTDTDPTSEEHYQYNLYYYGKEYADAYRDYYREHPDAEAMPDFIAQNALSNRPAPVDKKQGNDGKGKSKKDKGEKRKEPPKEEGWFEIDPASQTQLYVQGLPTDITEEEFNGLMSKCGLIMFDPLTHQPKIKLYKDKEGNLKGDGLCTYIKPESVALALQLLDGSEVRGHTIQVERAKFELKGNFDPKTRKKKKLSNKAKQKLREKQQKLFDWRPDKNPLQRGKHERIVILKNMFDVKEFDQDPALINELRADVRDECSKFGEVKKVTLYDRNTEGVISVSFKEPEEADACIAVMNGRWFAKKQIQAFTHDGKTKYDVVETEEERTKRLKEWEAFLEGKKNTQGENSAKEAQVDEASTIAPVGNGNAENTDAASSNDKTGSADLSMVHVDSGNSGN